MGLWLCLRDKQPSADIQNYITTNNQQIILLFLRVHISIVFIFSTALY